MPTCLCYRYTPCCGGHPVQLARYDSDGSPVTFPSLGDVYVYTGAPITDAFGYTLLTDQCYVITEATFGANDCNLALVPSPATSEFTPTVYGSCAEAQADLACIDCPKKAVFTPCCGGIPMSFRYDAGYPTSTTNVYQYTGGTLIFDDFGNSIVPYGCYTIQIISATATEVAGLNPGPSAGDLSLAGKACNNLNPLTTPCSDCFKFFRIVNCDKPSETYCTQSNLLAYINNLIVDPAEWPVIQVLEFPGICFYVEQIVSCTDPIVITPDPANNNFTGCLECQQSLIVYYELINCNDPQIVVYTSTNLTDFVGKYITLEEYGNTCFYVSVAQGIIPGDITVTPTGDTFDTCELCTTQKYLLQDCNDVLPDVITITDLSSYVGQIIVLETCTDVCWSVEETDLIGDTQVVVINTFDTCEDCTTPPIPQCVTFTNNSGKDQEVSVVDVNGLRANVVVAAGSTSPKDCYLSWDIESSQIIPVVYGDCVNNLCPEVPQPKRKVTPGYNTPACTPEYYEKVECNFSEWMYKDVLEQRYGISNCCPEELMKWEIKHEMLMLDSLVNPDYSCQPPIDCGCSQPTTCNCSCNSGN